VQLVLSPPQIPHLSKRKTRTGGQIELLLPQT
jgi:hypothetical protein